jgi:hypothetical protein
MVEYFLHPDRPFKLRPSQLLHLHRIALEGISSYAGNWRPAGIEIGGASIGQSARIRFPKRLRICAIT